MSLSPQVIHAIVHFALFGVFVDIIVNKVIYQKHNPHNISTHIFLAITLILSNILNQSVQIAKQTKYTGCPYIFVIELLLIIMSMFQAILGYHVYRKIIKGKNPYTLRVFKILHRINGFCVIMLGKVKIIMLIKYFTSGLESSIFHILWITYILLCMTLYLKFYTNCERAVKSNNVLKLINQNFVYKDIKDAVANEDIIQNDSIVSEDMSNMDSLRDVNTSVCYDINWIIFENKIYNLKQYTHPGGNMIINSVLKKDITKLFYGLDIFIFDNKSNKNYSCIENNHDVRSLNVLDLFYLSNITQEKIILNDEQDSSITYHNKSASVLFNSMITSRTDNNHIDLEQNYDFKWKAMPMAIDGYFTDHFMLAKQYNAYSEESRLNLSVYWVKTLGRYFIVQNGNERYTAYNILSFNPVYLRLKYKYFEETFPELFHYEKSLNAKTIQYLSRAEDIDQKFKYSSTNFTFYFNEHLKSTKDLIIKGPYGSGLGFSQTSTHNYIIIIENDGIVPFLDFFEILIQQHLLESRNYEIESWLFNTDYKFCYHSGLKLCFYWYINENYKDFADTIGFYHLRLLHFVNYKYKFNKDVIKEFYIKSNRFENEEFSFAEKLPHDFDFSVMKILEHSKCKTRNVIVSGSKRFKKCMVEGTGLKIGQHINFMTV